MQSLEVGHHQLVLQKSVTSSLNEGSPELQYYNRGYIGVISGYIRDIYVDNGEENGNYMMRKPLYLSGLVHQKLLASTPAIQLGDCQN